MNRAARLLLALAVGVTMCSRTPPTPAPSPPPHGLAFTTYHFDAARSGWSDAESVLLPDRVRAGLAKAWSTGPLDAAQVSYVDDAGAPQSGGFAPRLFASPLYLDDLTTTIGPLAGSPTSVVLAATSNDWVYAVAAVDTAGSGSGVVKAGTILWRTSLGTPLYVPKLDGGIPLGVLGTPLVDLGATPPTLYVTAIDASAGWRALAIDVTSGAVLPGWPVVLDPQVVSGLDGNAPPDGAGPPAMAPAVIESQRAALALSAGQLYVGFASYFDGDIGWMVAIDVASARVSASFSGSPTVPTPPANDPSNRASAGMWGAGGPAIASDGRVFMTTGNSPATALSAPGVWGNSLLAWQPGLALSATYTPFNYCLMDAGDTDLGGSAPVVFDVDPALTSTPHLATFGGKQGVLYLVDRDRLGGSLVGRPPCDPNPANDDPSKDGSLFATTPQPQYTPPSPGPLSVFGPYSDLPLANRVDSAKMRTSPALLRTASGDVFVFAAGTSKVPGNPSQSVPPCLVRAHVHLAAGQPAYLETDFATNGSATMKNPGSPVVTSHDGGLDPVVWVLDQNQQRSDPLEPQPGGGPPAAVLYAFDGTSLETLWQSGPSDLGPSAKYGHVVVAHGTVFVATDGITAFVAH